MKPPIVFGALLLAIAPPQEPRSTPDAAQQAVGPCSVRGKEPCVLTLKGPGSPRASASCISPEWSTRLKFDLPDKWSDSNGDGSWETVLEIRLDPTKDCGCARFKVVFDDPVSAWALDLGNSPTNDGHGGDEGTTPDAAELHVLDRKLTVYTASRPVPHRVERLLDETLPPLGGRTMVVEVCHQALAVELLATSRDPHPVRWKLGTLNSKLLFSLGPDQERADQETGGTIYAGLNRVIHVKSGAASHGRVGSGVRRVEISLSP